MGLISNQLDALYNGVNQQAAEHRLPTQVEEMINAYPTLDKGLLKRNPSTKLETDRPMTYSVEMFSTEYDRGLSGTDDEKYSINIADGVLEILNVKSGKVYNEAQGITFDGNSKDYLFPFAGINGYAATTVKDTTFIVNKSVVPKLKTSDENGTEAPVNMKKAIIPLLSNTMVGWYGSIVVRNAPHICQALSFYDGVTTVVVDGITTITGSYHATNASCGSFLGPTRGMLPYSSFTSTLAAKLDSSLPSDLYEVDTVSGNNLEIKRKDGANITVSITIEGVPRNGGASVPIANANYFGTISYGSVDEIPITLDNSYKYESFIWIEAANPSSKYTYNATIVDELGNSVTGSASETTTTGAALSLAANIDGDANFSASAIGSVVRVVGNEPIKTCEASDSYGNQASSSWVTEVQFTTDLPKNLGFEGSVVKVIGSGDNTFATFWLKYEESSWKETKQPDYEGILDEERMPHILVRNDDDTFTFKRFEKWKNLEFGGEDSNPAPSFIDSAANDSPVIKDIFFFKNRLGFITERTTIMSEVGEFGNFWRTTTAAVLDSDYIDATVDTTKVISLEYATYLEDSVMLFSDKAQFKLSGGRVLSPKDVQIAQTSSYEINKSIRPIFMNDKIFFASKRGDYSAVMQYEVKSNNNSFEAVDISAHVQTYIPNDIYRMSGSPINNMLFFVSMSMPDTIFVYKYYDNGADRVQSAWFKWEFNGEIYNAFSLGQNVNIMIKRKRAIVAEDWILGSGIWDGSKIWDGSQIWIGSPDDLTEEDQFEVMPIAPIDYKGIFIDDNDTSNPTRITTVVSLGEWVYGTRTGGKDIRGHLKFKTVMISSEEDSQFKLLIEDKQRNSSRTIDAKYTVNRKPMVYGDAKRIRVGIVSDDFTGFRINTVSFEGALTKRDNKL